MKTLDIGPALYHPASRESEKMPHKKPFLDFWISGEPDKCFMFLFAVADKSGPAPHSDTIPSVLDQTNDNGLF